LTFALPTAQAQVTYNFVGTHTGHNAYQGSIPATPLPPTSNEVPSTELSSEEYDDIESSNNMRHVTSPTTGTRAAQRYVFTLAQSGPSLFDMNVLWEGRSSEGGSVSFYVWDNNSSSYTLVESTTNSSSNADLTAVYTSPSQYVDANNKVTLLALNSVDEETVRTDYVRVTVRQCSGHANCNDNNLCTTDTCTAGLCSNLHNTIPCDSDGNACTNDVCAAGICTHPAVTNGTGCTDGNACTQTDTCQAGSCSGANPVVCPPGDACHHTGVCNPETGLCSSNPAKPDGIPCDDGAICNGKERCLGGICQSGTVVDCDVDVACTDDSCEESGGSPFVSTAVSHFDRNTHVVSLGSPPVGDFSAMMWARIDSDREAPSSFMFIGGSIVDPRYLNSFYLGTGGEPAGRRTWVQALTPGTAIDPGNSDELQLGDWHHFALVGNASSGGEVKLYLNGVLRQSGNAPAGTYISELIEILNAPRNNGNDRMVGSFTAWKRWNVQLSQSQIQAEMPYSRAVHQTNLIQEVTFLNNSDLLDQSGNGNHFTVTGPPLLNADVGPSIQIDTSVPCVHTPNNALCPDDSSFCNGAEFCDAFEGCLHAGNPCPEGQLCNEGADSCGICTDDADCDDGVACTDDECESGGCVYTPNNALCPDDGNHCNGSEYCGLTLGCQSTGNPCQSELVCRESDDSCVECLSDSNCTELDPPICEVVSGVCVECLTDADCDEGNPCIVGQTCINNACQAGTTVNCSESDTSCTTASCDSLGAEGNCDIDTPLPSGTACNDANECTSGDACHEGICHGEQPYTLMEWNELSQCLAGPNVVVGSECECSNLEPDDYMDLSDVAEFLNRFSGD